MIPLQNPVAGAFFALFSSRKFSRRSQTARRRLAALRAVTARQRFGMAGRAAALFGAGAVILLGSQSKSLAQATVPADTQYQYQNSTGLFSTGFTPTLGAGSTTTELNFGGTGPYTATDDFAALTVNDLSFFNSGLVSILSSSPTNTITLGGTTPQIFTASGSSALIDVILAGTAGFTKTGLGTLTLGATNTYTGTTTVNGGTLALDFTQSTAPGANIIVATSPLALGGGSLSILGAAAGSSQTFASAAFNVGGDAVSVAPGTGGAAPTLNLGAFTFGKGSSVVFNGPLTKGATNATVAATGTITTTTAGPGPVGLAGTFGVNGAGATATVGLYDWASTDLAAGTVGTSPYTIIGGSQVTGFYQTTGLTTAGNFDVVTGSTTASGAGTATTVRFNSPTALAITFSATTANGLQGILVTPNIGANNVTIGPANFGIEFQRSTSAGTAYGVVWQNNTLGFLNFNAEINGGRQAGQSNGLAQAGIGTVNYSGSTNGNPYELATYLNGGYTVITADNQMGNATTASAINLGGGTLFANTTFTLDNAGANARPVTLIGPGGGISASGTNVFTVDGLVTGTGQLTVGLGTLPGSGPGTANTTAIVGSGTVILSNAANTYSGGTLLNAGILRLTGAVGQLGTGGVTFNGGTFQFGSGTTTDISARPITFIGNNGAIDTNGNTVTFASSIGNSSTGGFIKAGLGTLTLGGANTYTGTTTVNAGSLLITNTTGSGTGTGAVTVNSGGTFGGTGISTGATTINGGGILSSNTSIPATLTLGSLTLADQSITSFGLGSGSSATITVTGALSLNGTDKINLLQIGTTSTFATAGTYTLFLDGSLTGSVSSLAVNNPAANTNYAFNVVGNTIQLTISGGLVNSAWNVDNNGNYSVASNWTNGVPNSIGAQAVFGAVITAPRTVTVDGTFTVGEIDFSNANAYTLTPGAAGNGFVFNNGNNNAVISDLNGSHNIGTPIALGLGLNVNVTNAADTLTVSGAISNTGAAGTGTLSKTGAGTLALLGTNTFDGGATITNGKVQINSTASLGAVAGTTTLDSTANTVTLEALNSITTARNFAVNGVNTNFQVDPGATYEIDGVIAVGATMAGTLTKTGTGTLALGNANTYAGVTTISAGTLSLVTAGANGGSVVGNIIDNAALVLGRTDASTVSNLISGTGTVTQAGSGNTTLSAANTFTGLTTITGGTLTLGNALALQNSTLNYDNLGGTFSFGTQTAATLIGLTGAQNLALTNAAATPAAVILTINNAVADNYTGTLSGLGALVKNGAGVLTIGTATTGGASFAGGATVNQGGVIFDGTGTLTGALNITGASGASAVTFQDSAALNTTGTVYATGPITNGNGFPNPATLTVKNNASVTAGNIAFGNGTARPANGDFITVQDTASLTANGFFELLNTVTGTTSQANTTVNLNGGTLSTQRFQITSVGTAAGTTATIRLNGGTLTALANDASTTSFFLPTSPREIVDVDTGGALVNTNGFAITFAQPLIHGTGTTDGGLTKNGLGTLTLAGANTYNGVTTINNGVLNFVTGGSTIAASAVTVNNTGTLSGTGGNVAGTVTVNTGGTLLAGTGGATPVVGNLTTGAVTLNPGSTFSSVLGGDSSFSQLLATSVSAGGGFSITLTGTATFAGTNEVLTLIPGNAFTGTFTNSTYTTGGYTFTADYTTNPGAFDVDVTVAGAVPEPATWLAGFLLVGAVGYKRRKQIGSLFAA